MFKPWQLFTSAPNRALTWWKRIFIFNKCGYLRRFNGLIRDNLRHLLFRCFDCSLVSGVWHYLCLYDQNDILFFYIFLIVPLSIRMLRDLVRLTIFESLPWSERFVTGTRILIRKQKIWNFIFGVGKQRNYWSLKIPNAYWTNNISMGNMYIHFSFLL